MGRKHRGEKEKLLVMSNFSFSNSIFKMLLLKICKNQGLLGKVLSGAEPHSSVGSAQDLRIRSSTRQLIFFSRIDDSHSVRIHSSLTAVHYFNNGYVGKQPVARKKYCAEHWLKELQESMDRCTGTRYN